VDPDTITLSTTPATKSKSFSSPNAGDDVDEYGLSLKIPLLQDQHTSGSDDIV
jgi:hypothetical protein